MMHRRIISLFLISLVTLHKEVAGGDGDVAVDAEAEGPTLAAEGPALAAEGPALTAEGPALTAESSVESTKKVPDVEPEGFVTADEEQSVEISDAQLDPPDDPAKPGEVDLSKVPAKELDKFIDEADEAVDVKGPDDEKDPDAKKDETEDKKEDTSAVVDESEGDALPQPQPEEQDKPEELIAPSPESVPEVKVNGDDDASPEGKPEVTNGDDVTVPDAETVDQTESDPKPEINGDKTTNDDDKKEDTDQGEPKEDESKDEALDSIDPTDGLKNLEESSQQLEELAEQNPDDISKEDLQQLEEATKDLESLSKEDLPQVPKDVTEANLPGPDETVPQVNGDDKKKEEVVDKVDAKVEDIDDAQTETKGEEKSIDDDSEKESKDESKSPEDFKLDEIKPEDALQPVEETEAKVDEIKAKTDTEDEAKTEPEAEAENKKDDKLPGDKDAEKADELPKVEDFEKDMEDLKKLQEEFEKQEQLKEVTNGDKDAEDAVKDAEELKDLTKEELKPDGPVIPVEDAKEEKKEEEPIVEESKDEEKPQEETDTEKSDQQKPIDEKPVDEKPVDQKPVDEKPVDDKEAEKEEPKEETPSPEEKPAAANETQVITDDSLKDKIDEEIQEAKEDITNTLNNTKNDILDDTADFIEKNSPVTMEDLNNLSVENATDKLEEYYNYTEALDDLSHLADNFTLAPQGENASFSIQFGNNEFSVSSNILEDGSEVLSHVFKFDKYFLYSYDTNAQTPGDPSPQCGDSNDCNQNFEQLCCANAVMTDVEHGTQTSIYRCMNKEVVNSNFDVDIEFFKISMRCVAPEKTSQSHRLVYTALLSIFSLVVMATI